MEVNKLEIDNFKTFLNTSNERKLFADLFITNFTHENYTYSEIPSDSYTQVMKMIYTVFDSCTSEADIPTIQAIFDNARRVFKYILLPDPDKTVYERIFLHQGLSAHGLFSNLKFWETYLKGKLQKLNNHLKQQQHADIMGDETNINGQEFLINNLKEEVQIMFSFDIDRQKIIKAVQSLEAFQDHKTKNCLIDYCRNFDLHSF